MNNRGQALVESLFVGMILVLAIGLFLRLMINSQKKILVDEFVEETMICLIQDQSTCTHILRKKLTEQGFKSILIQTQKSAGKWILKLTATTPGNEKIEKESELDYDSWDRI